MASGVSYPIEKLQGEVWAPRDKSISHRALILGALALGETHIEGLLFSDDVLKTWRILECLGVKIVRRGENVTIVGCGVGGLAPPETVLDCGNSGTAARLLCGLLAGHPFRSILTGDSSLRARPMTRVTNPLETLGAHFDTTHGRLPIVIHGAKMPMPLDCRIEVPSAQVKTALLLAGLAAPGTSRIIETIQTRDHTELLLRFFGAHVNSQKTSQGTVIEIDGQKDFWGRPVAIPGDASSSAFMIGVATCLMGSCIKIRDVCINHHRVGFLRVLSKMGCLLKKHDVRVESGEKRCDLEIIARPLRGVLVSAEMAPSMIDEYPIMAVVAACAQGTTVLEGLAELHHKESNRFTGIIEMLQNNGISVVAKGDSLSIEGQGGMPPGGGMVTTSKDHRLAMAGLALGCVAQKAVQVDCVTMISTSFPSFFPQMKSLGANMVKSSSETPS